MESQVEAVSNGNTTWEAAQGDSVSQEESNEIKETSSLNNDGTNETVDNEEKTAPLGGEKETVEVNIVYNKQNFNVMVPLDDTVESFKSQIEQLTGVPVAMQKLMFKGRMKDDVTLRDHKLVKGSKIMVVGSTPKEIMSVNGPSAKTQSDSGPVVTAAKEPLCEQKPHKTILDKYGKPDDVMQGIKNRKEALPTVPLSGMYNKSGGKVRLTFKLEQDQLWIGTRERTEKIPMNSIRAVVSEPIVGHEGYHIMGIQLGTTEASRYWIYWVPSQYVESIKDTVLGKWQCF